MHVALHQVAPTLRKGASSRHPAFLKCDECLVRGTAGNSMLQRGWGVCVYAGMQMLRGRYEPLQGQPSWMQSLVCDMLHPRRNNRPRAAAILRRLKQSSRDVHVDLADALRLI